MNITPIFKEVAAIGIGCIVGLWPAFWIWDMMPREPEWFDNYWYAFPVFMSLITLVIANGFLFLKLAKYFYLIK